VKPFLPVPPRYRVPRVGPYAQLTLLWAVVGLAIGVAAALFKLAYVVPLLLATFAWFTYRRIRITRASHDVRAFIAPMKRQDLPAVVEIAERLLPLARSSPSVLAIVVMTRAYAFLRQGSAELAAALFREVERSRWLARSQRHPQLSFFYRNAALACALRVESADSGEELEVLRLLDLAEANSDARDAAAQADLLLGRVVLALRTGKAKDALELLPRAARAPELRLLRVLALRQLSRPTASELAGLLTELTEADLASLAWLSASWPALAALTE
jgi:hypothetical protein